MSLVPLTDRDEITAAIASLRFRLLDNASVREDANIGWPGGSRRLTVYWRRERFWLHFSDEKSVHLLLCGTDNPAKAASLAITCEINTPREGINRKCAGALLRDIAGNVYLAHSGRIGGAGIAPEAFARGFAGANWQSVQWPDDSQSEMHVIAPLDGPRLAVQLAYFVHEVRRLKAALRAGETDELLPERRFGPELARARRPKRRMDPVEAQCDRGFVLAALHDALAAEGMRMEAAGTIDIATRERGRVRHAFCVQADSSPSGLIAAAGGLLLTTASLKPVPRRILVHPGKLPPNIGSRLAAAGIEALSFAWAGGRPVFKRSARDLG
jgi:hypothetical protein